MSDEETVMVFWQTRREVEQTLRTVLLHRPRLTEILGDNAEYYFQGVDKILRALPQWSAPGDLARVPVVDCDDLKCLRTAFEDACPDEEETADALGHIVDAAASGYWTGADEDTEDYRRTDAGWTCVRRRCEAEDE